MRHTRDGTIWIGSESFDMADVVGEVPSYSLPADLSFSDSDIGAGFIVSGSDVKQVALDPQYSSLCSQVDSLVVEIKAARDARIQAEKDAETAAAAAAAQAEYDAATYDVKRAIEYANVLPIGDQLDAILRWMDTQTGMPQEILDTITTWQYVKTQFPKV